MTSESNRGPATTYLGIDHLDLRVPDLSAVTRFYDALFPALGLSLILEGAGGEHRAYFEPSQVGLSRRYVALIQDRDTKPGPSRAAFTVASPDDVKRLAALLCEAGACAIEGPEEAYEHEPYCAVFFEDPCGTKLELCHRPGSPTFP